MTPFPARKRIIALAMLALASLSVTGCVRIGTKPPERLLSIAAATSAPAGQTLSASRDSVLFVDLPTVPRAIATVRVAVRTGDTSFAYVKDALWVDVPARQFQGLLAETIRTRTGRLVLDPTQFLARRGQLLEGSLLEFGIDAGRRLAIVTYDASLLAPDGQSLTRQRFTASVPVTAIDSQTVAPAISEAANQVATAVADWLKERPAG